METDWEVEVGGDSPVIDACWPGLVDLRSEPKRAAGIPEVRDLPALVDVLVRLNGPGSPVWTAKCDVWRVDGLDADELDAPHELAREAIAAYIDLLGRDSGHVEKIERAVAISKTLCAHLRGAPLGCCRADLVVRQAVLRSGKTGYGITAYLTACGQSQESAAAQLGRALAAFADSIVRAFASEEAMSTLQSKQAGE